MDLKVRETKGVMIIDIEGRINMSASELVELVGWLLKRGKRKFLLNFEQVDLLDYSGLTVLAITYKNVRNHDGVLKFVSVPLHIEKVFRIAQLLDVFELHGEVDRALASFDKKAPKVTLPHLRRRFKRLEIVNVTVRFLPIYRKGDPSFEGKAVNLSGEGLFLLTQKIFPLNTELILHLQLREDDPPLTMKGTVVWLADKEIQPHNFPGMGISFHEMDSDLQKRLLDFIDRNVTQRSD